MARTSTSPAPHQRRVILWLGFGGLLALVLMVAVNATRALQNLESRQQSLTNELRRRDETLQRLRADVYRSSAMIRDYSASLQSADTDRRRKEIEAMCLRMRQAVEQFQLAVPPAERESVRNLHQETASYCEALRSAPMRISIAKSRISGVTGPREEFYRHPDLIRVDDQIAAMRLRHLGAADKGIRDLFGTFRRRLILSSLLALAAGVALAIWVARRMSGLEQESQRRYREIEQASAELHRLSARLVTAQEEERRRVARELHDEVGQALSAILVELGNIEASPDPGSKRVRERLVRARQMAEESVRVVRNIALLLRPSMLDDLGLTAALQWQAREVSRRTGIRVQVDADETSDDLPDEHRTCIYRLVQEALSNVVRHSGAKMATVSLRQNATAVEITIRDNGRGFDVRRDKGIGILGMEERVFNLGGVFTVDSEPERGTIISATLPVQRAAALGIKGSA